ncbi:MAG: hypothetical protein QM642_11945 [Edaphocola sp.]
MKKILLPILMFFFVGRTLFGQTQNDTTDNSNDPPSIIAPEVYQPPTYGLVNANLSPEVVSFLEGKIANYEAYDFNYSDLNDWDC